jgi:hypothetical protein
MISEIFRYAPEISQGIKLKLIIRDGITHKLSDNPEYERPE